MSKAIIVFLLSLTSAWANAQTEWHLKREDDGIKIFTASTPNSDFKSIKVECTVNATLSQLAAFLVDITRQPDWVYNTKTTKQVRKISDNELVFYSEVNVPWPCTDRDYIAHFVIKQTSPGTITIDSHAEPDVLPEKDGIVRVRHSIAHWDVTAISSTKLKIIYTVQFDPGGSIPAWLTNMFVTKGPYQTFEKLREGVNRPEYRNAREAFIKE